MNKNKKQKWVGVVVGVLGLAFFANAQAFDPLDVYDKDDCANCLIISGDTPTTWLASENRVIDQVVLITNGATLKIEKGATIKFKREDDQWAPGIIVDDGKIVAEGTEKEPIIFTSDQDDSGFFFFFNEADGQESFFRHVTIEKAGGKYEVINDDILMGWWSIINVARAEERILHGKSYPVHYYRGKVRFENCIFNNPESEVEIRQEDFVLSQANHLNNSFQVVNSNFVAPKDQAVLDSELFCDFEHMPLEKIDEFCWSRTLLKNNWYAKASGPQLVFENSLRDYLNETEREELCSVGCQSGDKSIFGLLVNVEGYRTNDLIVDPAIVIPGIMGSEIDPATKSWVLDPILHTYDDLWESLKTAGFQEEQNLFAFPYQWRQKNEISAGELKIKIDEVKTLTGARKVDLVAHSMGGLLARYYIESDGTDENSLNYGEDVDQLITLGTPHQGAPSAYLQWEAGEGYFTWKEQLAKKHFKNEATHNGYTDIFSYIKAQIFSVQQLLPDSNGYLSGVNGFAFGQPQNSFLQKLNETAGWNRLLQKTRWFKIAGHETKKDSTITGLKLTTSSKQGLWADGMPENFYSTQSGIVRGAGDGTVPLASAKGETGGEEKILDAEHRKLPTEAQCEVVWNLGAKVCVKKYLWDFPNLLYFNVFSPVDIQVVAPNGDRVGKDFQTGELLNEIEGAFYSGFETENEFITVPVLAEGEYQLLTQGSDPQVSDRSYSVEVSLVPEEGPEKTVEFSGTANFDDEKTEILTVEENNLTSGETVSADELEKNFWKWWDRRRINKKVLLLLKDDLRNLTRWENVKKDAPRWAEVQRIFNKKFFVAQKKAGFLQQLRFVKAKLQKNRKNFSTEIYSELLTALVKLENAEKE